MSALCGGKANRRSATQLVEKHTKVFSAHQFAKSQRKGGRRLHGHVRPLLPRLATFLPADEVGTEGEVLRHCPEFIVHSHVHGRLKLSVGEHPRWLMIVASKGCSVQFLAPSYWAER